MAVVILHTCTIFAHTANASADTFNVFIPFSEFVHKLNLFLKPIVLIAVFCVGEVKINFVTNIFRFYSLLNAIANIPFLSLLPFQHVLQLYLLSNYVLIEVILRSYT